MSGGGVPCRPQNGGLQQLLDRIQTVRIFDYQILRKPLKILSL